MKQLDTRVAGLLSPATFGLWKALGLLLLVGWLAPHATQAQTPDWQQVLGLNVAIGDCAPAADGQLYLSGSFAGTVRFGSTTLTAVGLDDSFLAKWNPATQTFAWVEQLTGDGTDYLRRIAVQGTDVYLLGDFRSTSLTLGGTTLTNRTSSVGPSQVVFVAKLRDVGARPSYVWAQQADNQTSAYGSSLVVAGNNVYISGYFVEATFALGPFSLTNTSTGNLTGRYDIFVAKLTDAGATASTSWLQGLGGDGLDIPGQLDVQGSAVYLTGAFTRAATFGTVTLTGTSQEAFVVKLLDAGSSIRVAWAVAAGGTNDETGYDVKAVGNKVYLVGAFTSPTCRVGSHTLTNQGPAGGIRTSDGYVACLTDASTTATFDWALALGGTGQESISRLAVQANKLYVVGSFVSPTATFDTIRLANRGGADMFVANVVDNGSTGRAVWAHTGGSSATDGASVVYLRPPAVYVMGNSSAAATFGPVAVPYAPSAGASACGYWGWLLDPTLLPTAPAQPLPTLRLWPHPARGTAVVQLPLAPSATPVALNLLDALGRPLRTATVPAAQLAAGYPLDLAGLAPGLYLVRLTGTGPALTQRLVVE